MSVEIVPRVRREDGTSRNDADKRWDSADPEEYGNWPRTLWVDAGKVTGISVIWVDPVRFLDRKQPTIRSVIAWWECYLHGPENDQADQIRGLISELGGPTGLTVGLESFTVRQINMSQDFLSSPRITSKVDWACWRGIRDWDGEVRRRAVWWQSPSEALTAVPDARLRALGLYTPGPDHIRDATRHAVLHLRKLRSAGGDSFRAAFGWDPTWWENGSR